VLYASALLFAACFVLESELRREGMPEAEAAKLARYHLVGGSCCCCCCCCYCYCCSCRRFALESELRREGMPEAEAAKILGELEKRESDYMRLQRTRMTADDFEPLTIIGRGAFGEVRPPVRCCSAEEAKRVAKGVLQGTRTTADAVCCYRRNACCNTHA
jgi:hypothetical protein